MRVRHRRRASSTAPTVTRSLRAAFRMALVSSAATCSCLAVFIGFAASGGDTPRDVATVDSRSATKFSSSPFWSARPVAATSAAKEGACQGEGVVPSRCAT